MTLKDDIAKAVQTIFHDQWSVRDGRVVPEAETIALGNEAVKIEGAVLYADLSGSTAMVDKYKWNFAAEIYKTYLLTTARIIAAEGGQVVAYDGDRIMAIFIGDTKSSNAARCGLKINWATQNIVTPAIKAQYPDETFAVRQVTGVDTGVLRAARTGVRGANDLVWVGPAANYAAKLNDLDASYPTWITHRVYDQLTNDLKTSSKGNAMWQRCTWNTMGGLTVYRSTFWWPLS